MSRESTECASGSLRESRGVDFFKSILRQKDNLAPSFLGRESFFGRCDASLLYGRRWNRLVWSPRDIIQTLKMSLQTAAVGPGGVEILVVIVLLKFLKGKNKLET